MAYPGGEKRNSRHRPKEMGTMNLQPLLWKTRKLGEPPPVRFDCPLHVGELLPCRICASGLRRPQAVG
jgi:hypothetical protein